MNAQIHCLDSDMRKVQEKLDTLKQRAGYQNSFGAVEEDEDQNEHGIAGGAQVPNEASEEEDEAVPLQQAGSKRSRTVWTLYGANIRVLQLVPTTYSPFIVLITNSNSNWTTRLTQCLQAVLLWTVLRLMWRSGSMSTRNVWLSTLRIFNAAISTSHKAVCIEWASYGSVFLCVCALS